MDEKTYGQAYVGPVTVYEHDEIVLNGCWYLVKLPCVSANHGMLFSRNLMARKGDLIFDDE